MSSGRLGLFLISLYMCRKECNSVSSLPKFGLAKGCMDGTEVIPIAVEGVVVEGSACDSILAGKDGGNSH